MAVCTWCDQEMTLVSFCSVTTFHRDGRPILRRPHRTSRPERRAAGGATPCGDCGVAEGRMHASGIAEMDRAKADGRWEAAYAGPASIEVPQELTKALAANPKAKAKFATLNSQNRYAILFRLSNLKTDVARDRNVEKFIGMLERGETIYPQKPR